MSLKKRLFSLVKYFIWKRNIIQYKLRGSKPWGRGYFEYKWKYIEKYLNDPVIINAFSNNGILPKKFGNRIDERIVEYPWIITNLSESPAKLLDAGSALNFEKILTNHKLQNKDIIITTLNPEANCFWYRKVSYVYEDIRNLPFKSESFDIITSLSTIEHIGMDNTLIYTSDTKYNEKKQEDYLIAIKELKRVLKTGGELLITFPFGNYENFGFFQQFNKEMLNKLINTFNAKNINLIFYKYENGGWQKSDIEGCYSSQYITADRAKKDTSLPVAATAVACLKLTK